MILLSACQIPRKNISSMSCFHPFHLSFRRLFNFQPFINKQNFHFEEYYAALCAAANDIIYGSIWNGRLKNRRKEKFREMKKFGAK